MSEWVPATDDELAMRDALSAGDQARYFQVLARCELILPVPGQESDATGWGTWSADGRTHVLGFTSKDALGVCLAGKAGAYRRIGFEALAAAWPDQEWWLAVNPGLPIEGYLPAWFVSELGSGQSRIPGRTLGATARMEHARRLQAQSAAKTQQRSATTPSPASSAEQDSAATGRPQPPPRSPLSRRSAPGTVPWSATAAAKTPPAHGAAPAHAATGPQIPTSPQVPAAAPAPSQVPGVASTPPAAVQRTPPVVPAPAPAPPQIPAAAISRPSSHTAAPLLPRRTPGASTIGGANAGGASAGGANAGGVNAGGSAGGAGTGQPSSRGLAAGELADAVGGGQATPTGPSVAAADPRDGWGSGPGNGAASGSSAGADNGKDPYVSRSHGIGKGSNAGRDLEANRDSNVAPGPNGSSDQRGIATAAGQAPASGPVARSRFEPSHSRLDAVQSRIDATQARRSAEFVQDHEQISWPVPEPVGVRGHRPVVIEGSIVEVHGVEVHDGQTEPEPQQPAVAEPQHDPFVAANSVEESLLQAAAARRTDRFLSTLLLAKVLVPGCAGGELPDQGQWPLEEIDETPHLVAYTSTERLAERVDEQPTDFGWVKFTKLIESWPGVDVSFAVNPDTPVGATLPGDEIVALASWAAKMGLTDEPEAEEPQPAAQPAPQPRRAADVAKASDEPLVMQKPISPKQVQLYLDRGYDRVSGFVHRANEVDHLTSPERMYRAIGLGYADSAFKPDDQSIYLLRWRAYRANLYRIPYGGQNEAAMRAMEGWVVERSPFRGNGFAPNDTGDVIAEFKVDSARLPHGAQLWRLDSDGTERIIALLDADGPRWRVVGERNA